MKTSFNQFWNDDGGAVISAELVLVMTIAVLAVVVGLRTVSLSVNNELADVASAFGAVQQTYMYPGMAITRGGFGGISFGGGGFGFSGFSGGKGWVAGSGFIDSADFCDCSEVVTTGTGSIKGDLGGGFGGTGAPSSGSVPSSRPAPQPTQPPAVHDPCLIEPCPGSSIQHGPTPLAEPLPVVPHQHNSGSHYVAPSAVPQNQSSAAPPVLVVPHN